MRLLTFNIAYGTGGARTLRSNLLSCHHYLRAPERNIGKICRFIRSEHPDITALVEVDTGSFRTRFTDQTRLIAHELGDAFCCSAIKYHEHSIGRRLPILRKQANAILFRDSLCGGKFHYFPAGFKRLVIELTLPGCRVFLVHLALHAATRRRQLLELRKLIPLKENVIVTGDFNTLSGPDELTEFCVSLHLRSANVHGEPTFPVWKPEKELDFILCSPGIRIDGFHIPQVRCSDHLPLMLDFHY